MPVPLGARDGRKCSVAIGIISPLLVLAFFFTFLLAACGFLPTPPFATRLKIYVASDGFYRVSASALRAAGADASQFDASTLQLFQGDQEIAVRVNGQGANSSFDFYGQTSDSPYSAFNVYWLRWGVERGRRIREDSSLSLNSDAPFDSFEYTLSAAIPAFYAPQIGNTGSHWFWQSLTAPATNTITLALPDAISNPARLRVNLWSATADQKIAPDHHLTLFFNDARVADEKWDGQGARTIEANVPAEAVRAGENTLRLVAPGDTQSQAEVTLIQSVQVNYTRRLLAENDTLEFQTKSGMYRVGGFSSDSIELFDISDPLNPARVADAAINSRSLTFASDEKHRWLAIAPPAIQSPARIEAAPTTNLRAPERRGDYVIITHPDFVNALEPLVKHRQTSSLKVAVVTTNEVYDEFGFGMETPQAIRDFLRWARANWSPRFVLLVGKASYDYRNYLNAPNKNLLPTFLVETPHLGQAASDNWFIADEKTGQPALAIGRIPAKTPEQMTRLVRKIIAYESGSPDEWRRRAVFIADDKEALFAQQADGLATKIAPGVQASKVYLAAFGGDVNKARAEILSRWNAGAGWITYVGHGSIDTWAEGPLFSADNIGEVKNGYRLPILFTPTCLDGYFYHPQKDSLVEEMLFENDGGIIAGLAPTGLSLPLNQDDLMNALFDELFQNSAPTLGEAILRAKQKMKNDSPDAREVLETFVLLGDPALAVRIGK